MSPLFATPLAILGSGSGNPSNPDFDPAFYITARGFARTSGSDVQAGLNAGSVVTQGGNFTPLAGAALQDYLFAIAFDPVTRLASFTSTGTGLPLVLPVPVSTTPAGIFDVFYIITRASSGAVQRHIEVLDLTLILASGAIYILPGSVVQSNGAAGSTDTDWIMLGGVSQALSGGFVLSGTIRTMNLPNNDSANNARVQLQFGAVPEPGTYLLIGGGLLLFAFVPLRQMRARRESREAEAGGTEPRRLNPGAPVRWSPPLAA